MDWMKIITDEGNNLDSLEVIFRTIIIFIVTLFCVRIAKKRFLGKNTAFDIVLGIIVGSVISRAINGSAKLLPSVTAVLVLVGMHWLISAVVSRSGSFAHLVEGRNVMILQNGKINEKVLLEHHLRKNDLEEAARLGPGISNLEQIQEAYLESNGRISIIKKDN